MSTLLAKVENGVLILSASIMCLIAFLNVISRYFFGNSLAFTEEITINLFVLLTFVGAAVGVREKAHLGFTLIFDKVNESLKKALVLFSGLIVIIVFALCAYYGAMMVQFQMMTNQMTPALGWSQWVFTIGFPAGCVLCVIRAIESMVKELKILKTESD
ncbi:TRAP transporter small permease [Bacillus mesophilum]|uniref:TRAP transporter small permease n=1 Tax=Bacillus mesophilum TaxID=1071718 RepID=A0A7V7RJP6_9BACI|nr:TRAP transporter small permease [Bacillus mesophilum]KAB2331055.1 TRAP transporter small permease [Bacillus mesophilum]